MSDTRNFLKLFLWQAEWESHQTCRQSLRGCQCRGMWPIHHLTLVCIAGVMPDLWLPS